MEDKIDDFENGLREKLDGFEDEIRETFDNMSADSVDPNHDGNITREEFGEDPLRNASKDQNTSNDEGGKATPQSTPTPTPESTEVQKIILDKMPKMVTTKGCECALRWRATGFEEQPCDFYCCNPDSAPGGDWCAVLNATCEGSPRGICTKLPANNAVRAKWDLRSGKCTISDDGTCAMSPNYGKGNYDNKELCIFKVTGPATLDVVDFQTAHKYDYVKMQGQKYSGDLETVRGQLQGKPAYKIHWRSNYKDTGKGFKICLTPKYGR